MGTHTLEGHGAGKQTSNKCNKSVYDTVKEYRWNTSSYLMGQRKSLKQTEKSTRGRTDYTIDGSNP